MPLLDSRVQASGMARKLKAAHAESEIPAKHAQTA